MTPDEFEITAGVLQEDTLAPFLFVIIVDWIMRNAIEEIGEGMGFLAAAEFYQDRTTPRWLSCGAHRPRLRR